MSEDGVGGVDLRAWVDGTPLAQGSGKGGKGGKKGGKGSKGKNGKDGKGKVQGVKTKTKGRKGAEDTSFSQAHWCWFWSRVDSGRWCELEWQCGHRNRHSEEQESQRCAQHHREVEGPDGEVP